MKRVSFAVYMMALSLTLFIGAIGYVVRENRVHQQELAQATFDRQLAVNDYLVQVCDQFVYRDNIWISLLQSAIARYEVEDPAFADDLAQASAALQATQNECVEGIPPTEEDG